MLRTNLPESIKLPCGTVLSHKISYIAGVGLSKSALCAKIRARGGKYRLVEVFGRRLRGKEDLHHWPYRPSTWILTNLSIESSARPPSSIKMANAITISRRNAKAQWLREHPKHHEWLRVRVPGALSDWRKDPLATDMVSSLKAAGIYAPTTVSTDICAAMRRLAVKFEPSSPPPTERAAAEIEVILSREGVDRKRILKKLRA
jgi:hypothetical protein